ncbi:hypothetical protein GUA87_04900 [Sneathiella sp. P13V-1]|uniref:hypothetical protein n=1 Tax=Sneathiella sp. P13V-1 TaxID=2697366 RepID=UPI00187B48F9|nr:hypothetical protein [Sneathiella sp. P13V-1]MBE7636172.1 hypothetical protein [Sneathiella sp. P13V-1]
MTEVDKNLDQLLPFYANGTLEGAEKEAVEARLSEDADFRAELAYLKALRANIQSEEIVGSPGELGLKRLHKEMDAEDRISAPPAPANDNSFWRLTAIAAAIALVISVGMQVYGTVSGEDTYTTASGTQQIDGPVFQIFFKDDSSEVDIRSLLLKEGLTIVEGPTEIGYYRIASRAKLDNQALGALLKRLSASPLIQEALQE